MIDFPEKLKWNQQLPPRYWVWQVYFSAFMNKEGKIKFSEIQFILLSILPINQKIRLHQPMGKMIA
jgi:hypothetical protein